jgi:hypothetical protein
MCGQTFAKGWSDEEALVELKNNFNYGSIDNCNVVCDDCYNRLPISYETMRKQWRKGLADHYRAIRKVNPALARIEYVVTKQIVNKFVNEILYGTSSCSLLSK